VISCGKPGKRRYRFVSDSLACRRASHGTYVLRFKDAVARGGIAYSHYMTMVEVSVHRPWEDERVRVVSRRFAGPLPPRDDDQEELQSSVSYVIEEVPRYLAVATMESGGDLADLVRVRVMEREGLPRSVRRLPRGKAAREALVRSDLRPTDRPGFDVVICRMRPRP